MKEAVLPLETILFQTLLLLVAIALEARVFYYRLNFGRQTSVKYAVSINLLATIISWLSFFLLQHWLPQELEIEIINFVFFDRIAANQTQSITLLTVSLGIAVFFVTFIIKLKGLDLLQFILKEDTPTTEEEQEEEKKETTGENWQTSWANWINQVTVESNPNQAAAVLFANGCSFSGIVVVLLIRFLFKT
ncbi:MAG: hypothetical protein F6K47_37900 [Symploca sp. SIO2E6]|nr:hypothetical protein [Symploca sp. SIO2E6]